MTYNEFILYRQEHYYFAKDNGLPVYSKDDLNLDVLCTISFTFFPLLTISASFKLELSTFTSLLTINAE